MKKKTASFSFDLESPQVTSDEMKFSLYVKAREVKQISDTLQSFMLLPDEKKKAWALEHEALLADLVDSFVEDSMMAMDGLQMDQETMTLSMDLVTQLREVMTTLQSILSDKRQLTS